MNWERLKSLRSLYIAEPESTATRRDYWADQELLADYDQTFAQRIRWKWLAVLDELAELGRLRLPQNYVLYDWGCGTGIAARTTAGEWHETPPKKILLWDRSVAALQFSRKMLRSEQPAIETTVFDPSRPLTEDPGVVLVSHVLTELDDAAVQRLVQLVSQAAVLIWVEPGIPRVAAKLVKVRDALRAHAFVPVAPCTHVGACGMLTPENSSNWCHHFAKPPSSVFRDPFWNEFSKKMQIDLRSLPVSYLVMAKQPLLASRDDAPQRRVIGRARVYKGRSKYLGCDDRGVFEHEHTHRHDKSWAKRLDQGGWRLIAPPDSDADT